MRWTANHYHKNGATRLKEKFLLFPKRIGRETRWLEYATWREKFKTNVLTPTKGGTMRCDKWKPTDWVDLD